MVTGVLSPSPDDVFLPKDIDLDNVDMDETEREVECFKRCVLAFSLCEPVDISLHGFYSALFLSAQVLLGLCSTDQTEAVHQLVQL